MAPQLARSSPTLRGPAGAIIGGTIDVTTCAADPSTGQTSRLRTPCPLLAHTDMNLICNSHPDRRKPSPLKLTILRAISYGVTAYPHTARRFSLFIFIVSLSPSRKRGNEFLPARKRIDENASHCRSVCNLDRLQLPRTAARGGGNVHFAGLLLQNRNHHTDRTKASAIQART